MRHCEQIDDCGCLPCGRAYLIEPAPQAVMEIAVSQTECRIRFVLDGILALQSRKVGPQSIAREHTRVLGLATEAVKRLERLG
jgi:hypothetical protein